MFWSNRRDRFAFSDGTKSFGVALRNLGVAPKVGVAGVAPEVGEKAPLCTPLCTPLPSRPFFWGGGNEVRGGGENSKILLIFLKYLVKL